MQNCQSAAGVSKGSNVKNCLLLVKVTLPAVAFMLLCNLCMTISLGDITKGMLETERKTVASIEHLN